MSKYSTLIDTVPLRLRELAEYVDDTYNAYRVERPSAVAVKIRLEEAAHELRRAEEIVTRVLKFVNGDDGEESFIHNWDTQVRKPFNQLQS